MNLTILRSVLMTPVNVTKFVEKACLRGADAVALDLEDSIPAHEKIQARTMLKNAISIAGKGVSKLMVRVNNEPELLEEDIEAAVCERLDAIFIPKVETAAQVVKLDYMTREIEASRGLELGKIRFSIHIESPQGILLLPEIARSSSRIESMSIGVDDYCAALGVGISDDLSVLLVPMTQMIITAKAFGIIPIGVLGSVAEFRNLETFESSAIKARNLGSEGSICVHPDQVPILNSVFAPTEEDVSLAQRIVDAFTEAVKDGRASTSLDGRMVDTPIYKQALSTLEKLHAIERYEDLKTRGSQCD